MPIHCPIPYGELRECDDCHNRTELNGREKCTANGWTYINLTDILTIQERIQRIERSMSSRAIVQTVSKKDLQQALGEVRNAKTKLMEHLTPKGKKYVTYI